MTPSSILLRSLMFVPANNQKYLDSSLRRNADLLLLDCEDSVPSSEKAVARTMILDFIKKPESAHRIVCPRINDINSDYFIDDIMSLTEEGVYGFMIPKVGCAADLEFVSQLLSTIERKKGKELGSFKLIPLIESTMGVCNINEICKTSKERVFAVAFGCEDYLADLNGTKDSEGNSIFYARNAIVNAARANGLAPIDTVHTNVGDMDELHKSVELVKGLGFEGMLVINPKELDIVNSAFAPSAEEVRIAQEIVDSYEEAIRLGKGEAIINHKFVGPPMAKKAKMVLEKNKLVTRQMNF